MELIIGLAIIAVVIEAIVEVFKGALAKWAWLSVALGAVICPLAGLDAFAMLGLPLVIPGAPEFGSFLGAVLTGVMTSRGASFLYDVWKRVRGVVEEEPVTR